MPTFTPGPGSSEAKDGTEIAEKVMLSKSTSFAKQDSLVSADEPTGGKKDSLVSAPDMDISADLQKHAEQLVIALRRDPSLRVSASDLDAETQEYLMGKVGSQVTVADVVKSMKEADKANQDAQRAQNAARMWKKLALWLVIVCVVLLVGMFSTTVGAIQLTKEIRATSGGVLQTQDGDTALVGSSDTKVCGHGELCSRNSGLAISTATVSVSLSFRKLASAASNLTFVTPLLTDATAASHLNPYGEIEQSKVRRASTTSSKTGNQVSFSLEVSGGPVDGATLRIGKSTTTYTGPDMIYETSGQVFFQLTPTSEATWQAIMAMQGSGRRLEAAPDDEPLAASHVRMDGLHGQANGIIGGCAGTMIAAFSKDVMTNPALDSLEFKTFRKNQQSICDRKCQPRDGCIVAPGHCTSQVFRALEETNQTDQLAEACEDVFKSQASVRDAEEELNQELEKTNAKNNATFAYGGGGRRLEQEKRRLWWGSRRRRSRRRQTIVQRLAGFGTVGCCSTGIGMVAGSDSASCFDDPNIHHTGGWWGPISSCCAAHDHGCRVNTNFDPNPRNGQADETDCVARGNADYALYECANSLWCDLWPWNNPLTCNAYHFVLKMFMKGRPNSKGGPCKS